MEVDTEGLCSGTSGDLWVMSLLLSLSEVLNCSSPLVCAQNMCVCGQIEVNLVFAIRT
jgi:hypothetical protein